MDIKNSINGSVQSQGIKLDVRDWLDIGSEGWKKATDEEKAKAYQAAKVCGWTDSGLIALIVKEYSPRLDEADANFIIELLKDLAGKYPVEIETVREVKTDKPIFRKSDSCEQWLLG